MSEIIPKINTMAIMKILSGVIILVGILVMIGWAFDIFWLKSIFQNAVSMKVNAAIAFIFSGIAIYVLAQKEEKRTGRAKFIFALSGMTVFILMIMQITSSFIGLSIGLEKILTTPTVNEIKTFVPGLPSYLTIINFLLVAILCIFEISEYSKLKKFLLTSGIFIGSSGVLCLIGYALDISYLYYYIQNYSSAMAIHAGILFTIMGSCFSIFGIRKRVVKNQAGTIKIRNNLLALFLIISLVPTVIIATIAYTSAVDLTFKKTVGQLELLADHEKDRFSNSIDFLFTFLSIASNKPLIIQNLDAYNKNPSDSFQNQISEAITASKNSYSNFGEISIFTLNGVVLASTESKLVGNTYHNGGFVSASKGNNYFDVFLDDSNNAVVRLTMPLYLDGKMIGVVSATVDSSVVFPAATHSPIGQTGEIVFGKKIDNENILLISPLQHSSDLQLKPILASDLSLPINMALHGEETTTNDSVDYANVPVVAVTRYVDNANLGLVVKIAKSEILSNVNDIKNLIITMIIPISIFIVILSILFARTISRPIIQLKNVADEISKGNYDVKNIAGLEEIHELTNLEHSFDSMASTIKTVNIQKDEFSSMVTHELKTPLTPIKGRAEMLLEPGVLGNLNELQSQSVKIILDSASKLERLIGDVLDAQKIDMKRMKFNNDRVQIRRFMEGVKNEYSTMMKDKKIELVNATTSESVIVIDEGRLVQILMNLIRNSVDFVPDEAGKIEIGAFDQKNDVVFFVKDNGLGIPADQQENLFKKFFQVDTSHRRKHGGTGLGLVICKGIVEAHGGKIWFESKENQGTTFYFSIPKNRE